MTVTLDILLAAKSGDRSAQDTLMRDLYTPVYHFLLKRTGNTDTADELSQTVFLKCYERLNHYEESKGSVYTWVFTITRRTLIDHLRKKKDESHEDLTDLQAEDLTTDTESETKRSLDAAYVARLLRELPEEEADIVTLRAIKEMPYEEIGAIMGKSSDATRKMYSRALKRLKEIVVAHPA